MFMLSRDNSDQSFGNLGVSSESFTPGTMPMGCTVYVDAQKSENCQIRFDADIFTVGRTWMRYCICISDCL